MARGLSAAVVTRTIVIVALADDFPTADDDTAMTIMKRRQRSLLKAKREISIVARHDEDSVKNFWIFCWESVFSLVGQREVGKMSEIRLITLSSLVFNSGLGQSTVTYLFRVRWSRNSSDSKTELDSFPMKRR